MVELQTCSEHQSIMQCQDPASLYLLAALHEKVGRCRSMDKTDYAPLKVAPQMIRPLSGYLACRKNRKDCLKCLYLISYRLICRCCFRLDFCDCGPSSTEQPHHALLAPRANCEPGSILRAHLFLRLSEEISDIPW
jgi:hypothetical protein